jgi:hypothetical protein
VKYMRVGFFDREGMDALSTTEVDAVMRECPAAHTIGTPVRPVASGKPATLAGKEHARRIRPTSVPSTSRTSRLVVVASGMAASMAILGSGCAASNTAYRSEPLARVAAEKPQRAGDPDLEISVGKLSREAIGRVLGQHGEELARNATILEARISAGAAAATVSPSSFRLRLPSGFGEQPLETRWVLAAMDLPNGPGWCLLGVPRVEEPGDAYVLGAWLALAPIFLATEAVARVGPEHSRDAAAADVWLKTALPRVIAPETSLDLLLVFWPRMDRVPAQGTVPLEVQLELDGCTWRHELAISLD